VAADGFKGVNLEKSSLRHVVFIVAHPDDVAFYMGGTAILLKDHYRLHVICASRGERGYAWDGPGRIPPNPELACVREQEEREACAILGASIEFLGVIDGDVYAERPVVEAVAKTLEALRPIAVLTHGPQEKPDHAGAFLIALQALQKAGIFWDTELYMIVQYGTTTHGRYADMYVNISEVIEQKRLLVACHRSHHTEPNSVEHWIEPNAVFGRLAWCHYAEAFLTAHPPMARRSGRKVGSILMELEP
jgi:LmbE family N-acetylglucosaminyl deacetylase